MERPCAWKKYTPQQIEELEELCRGYKQFLSENKTERLCVKTAIKMAEEAGYVDLETVIAEGRELKAGDKVHFEKVSIAAAQEALLAQRATLNCLRSAMNR